MATHKRINITIHPIELKKLKKIAKDHNETISGMITRLIQEYKSNERDLGDITEIAYYATDKKRKKGKNTGDLTDPDYDRRFRCKGKNQ